MSIVSSFNLKQGMVCYSHNLDHRTVNDANLFWRLQFGCCKKVKMRYSSLMFTRAHCISGQHQYSEVGIHTLSGVNISSGKIGVAYSTEKDIECWPPPQLANGGGIVFHTPRPCKLVHVYSQHLRHVFRMYRAVSFSVPQMAQTRARLGCIPTALKSGIPKFCGVRVPHFGTPVPRVVRES